MITIVKNINKILLEPVLIPLLLGTGIYFTLKLNFVQIRKFSHGLKHLLGSFDLNGEKAGKSGMSSFQSLATAIAAQVGTGNLAGAATALASGGPGAIFWMWVSAFFGMSTIYSEAVLSQLFKKEIKGQITGGPAFYIENSLKNKKFAKILAYFFAFSCILALGLIGNSVQSNSIATAFNKAFNIEPCIVGIFIATLAGIIFFGGTKLLASVTEKIVPIMAGLYILACFFAILINFREIIPAFSTILKSAFTFKAASGGVLGVTIKEAIRYGVARGLFSNEAGMGSTPHAHAVARVKHPCDQGVVAILTVFIDTFIVLNGTVLVILTSKVNIKSYEGIILTQKAFSKSFGYFGESFVAIALLFFAFSTILGWYFFGEANILYLFKSQKMVNIYRAAVMIMLTLGAFIDVKLIWEVSDLFNCLMVLPNLIGLLFLGGMVKKAMKTHKK